MKDFERQVHAYRTIHANGTNRALHAIGIPILLFSIALGWRTF